MTPEERSDEWFANNLVGLIKGQQALIAKGKQKRLDKWELVRFIEEYNKTCEYCKADKHTVSHRCDNCGRLPRQ